MVTKVTLDTNCLIALENNEITAPKIRALRQLSKCGKVKLAILGISASENQRSLFPVQNFKEFQERISKIGLHDLDILQPIAFFDVTFWDWCVFPSDEDIQLFSNLWTAIFPNIESDWQKLAKANGLDPKDSSNKVYKKWRNAHCDVQIAWATIKYNYDAIITLNSSDFHKNIIRLRGLGLRNVWTPEAALNNLQH